MDSLGGNSELQIQSGSSLPPHMTYSSHDFAFNQPTPPHHKVFDATEGSFSWELKSPMNIVQRKVTSPVYTLGNVDW